MCVSLCVLVLKTAQRSHQNYEKENVIHFVSAAWKAR